MDLYEITGRNDSELENMIFGSFTTNELAVKGYQKLPEEIQDETEVSVSNLKMNTIEIDDKVIDLTSGKSAQEIISSRDEDNYVEGFVRVHISDVIDNDLDGFLDLISENLVGSPLLMDVNYNIVGLEDNNTLVLKVRGDASTVIQEQE